MTGSDSAGGHRAGRGAGAGGGLQLEHEPPLKGIQDLGGLLAGARSGAALAHEVEDLEDDRDALLGTGRAEGEGQDAIGGPRVDPLRSDSRKRAGPLEGVPGATSEVAQPEFDTLVRESTMKPLQHLHDGHIDLRRQ